jgi:hypothetical protein
MFYSNKIIFYCLFLTNLAFSQKSQYGAICNIEGNSINSEYLRNNAKEVSKNDEVYGYLNRIIQELKPKRPEYFSIYDVPDTIIASAAKIPESNLIKAIYINKTYYKLLFSDSLDREALFIYIFGHEITHHIEEHVEMKDISEFESYFDELEADEKAGQLVAKLTNMSLDYFENILDILLRKESESKTHPAKKYRILAAKAGYIQAKAVIKTPILGYNEKRPPKYRIFNVIEDETQKEISTFTEYPVKGEGLNPRPATENNPIFMKIVKNTSSNSVSIFNTSEDNKKQGVALNVLYKNKVPKQIEFYNYKNDSIRGELFMLTSDSIRFKEVIENNFLEIIKFKPVNLRNNELYFGKRNNFLTYDGEGILFYENSKCYSGNFNNGHKEGQGKLYENAKVLYVGNFKNDLFEGAGKYFYRDGKIYFGYWKLGKENGYGIKYKGQDILENGCWINGKFQGSECEK